MFWLPEAQKYGFSISRVVRYLFWLGKPAIVRDEEIDTIKKWLDPAQANDVSLLPFK
jgi:sugar phosphate isomerase/epimerase